MLYLIKCGLPEKRAFKFMESVRKGAIHKGKAWPEGIVEEMREHQVPEWYIESCKKIKYLFPKAHAAAYVMMAFRIACSRYITRWRFMRPISTAAVRRTASTP